MWVIAASSPRPYHHGHLRDALVTAAEGLMAVQSGWTFTLREVARAANVSHNAPYNHFADRRALLAAIAVRGFKALGDALRRELATISGDHATARIRATARAYLGFALAQQAHYRLMFGGELAGCAEPAFVTAGAEAFAVLREVIAEGVAVGHLRADPGETHALAAWSLVHGLAMLLLDGKLSQDNAIISSQLVDQLVTSLLDGLMK